MKTEEKNRAINLRKSGYSIKEISKELNVSRGSVSLWVRNIILEDHIKESILKRGLEKTLYNIKRINSTKTNRDMHEKIREQYRNDGKKLAESSDLFRIISSLYWGEGDKKKNSFSVSNCDSDMLRIIGNWLCQNGYVDKISFVVQYYLENEISEEEIKSFWKSKLSFLEDRHFRKFTIAHINRVSQRKRIGKQVYGTARISVHCTKLIQMIYGGIEYLKGQLV